MIAPTTMFVCVLILSVLTAATMGKECGLYLAETMGTGTMPPSYAVYSGIDRKEGTMLGLSNLVIPMIDLSLNNNNNVDWQRFLWDARQLGVADEGVDVRAALLGISTLARGSFSISFQQQPNAFLLSSNVDNLALHRSEDPAAGAITYYHDASVVSMQDIQQGQEITFGHSHQWSTSQQNNHHLNTLPSSLQKEDPKVQAFLNRYSGLAIPDSRKIQLFSMLQQDLSKMSESSLDDAVRRLLLSEGQQQSSADDDEAATTSPSIRSIEWLEQHAMCLDNLIPTDSIMDQAGRGAVASRTFKKGNVLVSAPTLTIPKAHLEMQSPYNRHDKKQNGTQQQYQLLMNYCFGHAASSQLLCPIGGASSLINHSPTPNAYLRWKNATTTSGSTTETTRQEEEGRRGDGSVNRGGILEYVALRDIGLHEEVTIDYGKEWQEAWTRHEESWPTQIKQPSSSLSDYVSAQELNDAQLNRIRTIAEQQTGPYPSNLITSCHFEWNHERDSRQVTPDTSGKYAGLSSSQNSTVLINHWASSLDHYDDRVVNAMVEPSNLRLRPCLVLERHYFQEHEDEYVVQILNTYSTPVSEQVPEDHIVIVTGLPRAALTFTDFAYTTDMHLSGAFRHYMTMNDIFPRNLLQ